MAAEGLRRLHGPDWYQSGPGLSGLVPVRVGLVIDFRTSPVRTGNSIGPLFVTFTNMTWFWLRIAPHAVRSVHGKLHMHVIPRWKQLAKCRLYAVRYTLYSNRLKSCQHFKLHCFQYLHHVALALC